MNNAVGKTDRSYAEWLETIKSRYARSQIKAAVQLNREMLLFYWSIGRDIVAMEAEKQWGSAFYQTLSNDLTAMLPGGKRVFLQKPLLYEALLSPDPNHGLFPTGCGKRRRRV